MTKFSKKSKKPCFWGILGSFCSNLGQNRFTWKKRALLDFRYSNYLPLCKKSKKLMIYSWEKYWTDKQTDGQTDNSDFIGPSLGGGPKSSKECKCMQGLKITLAALQIRANQWSITTSLQPLTTHIYHVMIIVMIIMTSGFSKNSFLLLFPRNSFERSWTCFLGI